MLSDYQWLRAALEDSIRGTFRNVEFDAEKYENTMRRKPAQLRYAIFFTPRSGSSRLADLIGRTGAMGKPGECYNPLFIPAMAQSFSARNIREYTELVVRRRKTRGVFGCEVTHMHLVRGFWRPSRFLDMLDPTATFWLIREDIIAQAVSVSRMMQTQVSHSVNAEELDFVGAEEKFTYNARAIRSALKRLRWMEAGTETLLRSRRLDPMRLSYEQTISAKPRRMMIEMADHIGVPRRKLELAGIESDHQKVSGEKSDGFAARFRKEFPDLVANSTASARPC